MMVLKHVTPMALALGLAFPIAAFAAGGGGGVGPNDFDPILNPNPSGKKIEQGPPTDPRTEQTKARKKKEKKEEKTEWRDGYRIAVSYVQDGRYDDAITTFVNLQRTDSPDVQNYIGYANRKMGRMEEARVHYEAALALDPEHRGALEYYGEWHVEMGKLGETQIYLRRLASVCGTTCQEYQDLAGAIATRRVH